MSTTQDINPLGVPAHRHTNANGDLGGWVADTASVPAHVYVGRFARVYGGTIRGGTIEGGTIWGGTIEGGTIRGGTIEGGTIWGGTIEGGTIWGGTIWGGTIWGGTIEGGTIWGGTIRGGTIRGGTIWGGTIRGGTIEGGTIRGGTIRDGAHIVHTRHITTCGPLGSEGGMVTLFRTNDGHLISAGCWKGSLDEMLANVTDGADKPEHWGGYPDDDRARWSAEFVALAEVFRLRIAEWDAEGSAAPSTGEATSDA